MGSNDSKQANEKKTSANNNQSKPVVFYSIRNSDSAYESESRLAKELPRQKHRNKKLQNPSGERPIELSWLQQNTNNDNNNQTHHHDHHQHLQRIPLAINRWPKDDQAENQEAKTFAEEYIRRH